MNSRKLLLTALFAANGLMLTPTITVSAADPTVIDTPSDFAMTVDGAAEPIVSGDPLFAFKTQSAGALMSNDLTAPIDYITAPTITVTDYTGSGNGWLLSASLSELTTTATGGQPISGTLHLAWLAVDKQQDFGNPLTPEPLTDADKQHIFSLKTDSTVPFWDTRAKSTTIKASGQGVNKITFDPDATTFTLNQNSHVLPEEYTAGITWTLSSTPT